MSIREKITEIKKLFQKNGAKKVDRNFEKGLAIIVGNKPDGILVHVAYVLGLNKNGKYFYHLDAIREEIITCGNDDIIYLIGHGSSKNHTIDGQKMEDIAEKLWYAGYRGKQILYITSCYAKALTRGMSTLKLILSYLKKLFGSEINIDPKTSMLNLLREKLEEKGVPHDKIQSDFDGLSITVDSHGIKAWNVKSILRDNFKQIEQIWFLYFNKLKNVKYLSEKDLNKIRGFKIGLIKDFGGKIMDNNYCPYWWIYSIVFGFFIIGGSLLILGGLLMRVGWLNIADKASIGIFRTAAITFLVLDILAILFDRVVYTPVPKMFQNLFVMLLGSCFSIPMVLWFFYESWILVSISGAVLLGIFAIITHIISKEK